MVDLDFEEIDYLVERITRDQRGLSKVWAGQMALSQASLNNKTCSTTHNTHLSPSELLNIMALSGDVRVLHSMADQLGYDLISKTTPGIDLLSAVLVSDKEHGDIGKAIMQAMADGVIDKSEQLNVKQQITEAREALNQLEASVDACCKNGVKL